MNSSLNKFLKTTIAVILASTIAFFGMRATAAGQSDEIKRLIGQGSSEVLHKRYDQAVQTFSAALRMSSDATTTAEILGNRGGAYIEKGQFGKAKADGDAAIRGAPQYFRGYQLRGRVYRHLKQFDRALSDLNMAIKLTPTFAQLYNNRGNIFADEGQSIRAIQDYNEAIRLAPRTVDGYENRGGTYVEIGQYDNALTDLNRAIGIDPRNGDLYLNRAAAYLGKQDHRAALADYTKADELSPNNPATLNSIAWLKSTCPLDSVRNGREAVKAGERACRLTGFKDAAAIDTLAAAYAESGDFERAVEYVSKALRMNLKPGDRKKVERRLALFRDRKPYRNTEPLRVKQPRG